MKTNLNDVVETSVEEVSKKGLNASSKDVGIVALTIGVVTLAAKGLWHLGIEVKNKVNEYKTKKAEAKSLATSNEETTEEVSE